MTSVPPPTVDSELGDHIEAVETGQSREKVIMQAKQREHPLSDDVIEQHSKEWIWGWCLSQQTRWSDKFDNLGETR